MKTFKLLNYLKLLLFFNVEDTFLNRSIHIAKQYHRKISPFYTFLSIQINSNVVHHLQTFFYQLHLKWHGILKVKSSLDVKNYALLSRIFYFRTGATLQNRNLKTFPNNLPRSTSSPVKVISDVNMTNQ